MGLLGDAKDRFSALGHSIEGISQRMLTLTLKELQNWEIGPAKIAKEFRAGGTNATRRSPKMCKAFADPRAIAPVRGGFLLKALSNARRSTVLA